MPLTGWELEISDISQWRKAWNITRTLLRKADHYSKVFENVEVFRENINCIS